MQLTEEKKQEKETRRQIALGLLSRLEKIGISRYQIDSRGLIKDVTMYWWTCGKYAPSKEHIRILKRLLRKEEADGKRSRNIKSIKALARKAAPSRRSRKVVSKAA